MSEPSPEPKRTCPEKPSLTVDLNIGEGPVHLEFISENIQRPNAENDQPELQNNENDDKKSPQREEVVQNRDPTPPPRENEVRNRDLRVIIERLDPGLHIVIDRAGRMLFGPMRPNNFTKLKVFMARGYKMITDQALRYLSDLRLELLDVTGTSVTAKGIHDFLMVNPDCRVIHESICNCS